MNAQKKTACAPLKLWVIVPALVLIVLLCAVVCFLHRENAVSLRGEVRVSEYAVTDAAQEGLVLMLDDPYVQNGVLHISGALLRPGQEVGGVAVRAALISEAAPDTAILLNTQMLRRPDAAAQYGADDHCGFHAAVDTGRLLGEGYQYRVALADETGGAKNLIETDMTITPIEGGMAFARVQMPESEAQHD